MRSTRNCMIRRGIEFTLAGALALALSLTAGAQAGSGSKGSGRSHGSGGVSGGIPGGVSSGVPGGISGGIDRGVDFGVGWGVSGGVLSGIGTDGVGVSLDGVGPLLEASGNSLGAYRTTLDGMGGKLALLGNNNLPLSGSIGAVEFGEQDSDRASSDRENRIYNEGASALNSGKYDRAVELFDEAAQMKGKKADAALHWKAWALNRLGKRAEALSTLAEMERDYPKSKWLDDAKTLEIEIKQQSGQPVSPDSESNCELKLMAINGLQQADPAKSVPLLEKMLHSPDCLKVRSQALFVLAQSNSPEARDLMIRLARGESNPAVQQKAIQALGMYSGSAGRDALGQIYSSSSDLDTKKTILQALMMSGDRTRILNAAKNEKEPALRSEAIRQLGMMGARDEVWQLYQSESSVEVKKQILQAMWMSGDRQRVGELAMKETDHSLRLSAINDLGLMGRDSDSTLVSIYNSDPDPEIRKKVLNALFLAGDRERMGDLAKNEKDHNLRLSAINYLGLMGKQSDGILIEIYNSDHDSEIRKKVINALFLAGDAKSMVEIARKETDPTMKRAIISQLSIMNQKEATDYLMEILNK